MTSSRPCNKESTMNLENKLTAGSIGWCEGTDIQGFVRKHLPVIPDTCMQLFSCGAICNACQRDSNVQQHLCNAHQLVDVMPLTAHVLYMLHKKICYSNTYCEIIHCLSSAICRQSVSYHSTTNTKELIYFEK